jgi:hypothetical protein
VETSYETHRISQRARIIKRQKTDKKPNFQGKAGEFPAVPYIAPCSKSCALSREWPVDLSDARHPK